MIMFVLPTIMKCRAIWIDVYVSGWLNGQLICVGEIRCGFVPDVSVVLEQQVIHCTLEN